jgi:MFS family permease
VRRFVIDLTPLRQSTDFRAVFTAGMITSIGSMITYVALPFQVAQLTDSYLAVGLIGLAEVVPLIVFGLYGGALADAADRRLMVIGTEMAAAVIMLVLLVNSLLPDPHLWLLYLCAMLLAANSGLQRPSLDAITPRVVPHDQLAAAGALNTLRWNLGSIAGPAVGGLLLASGGSSTAYAIDLLSFIASIVILWRLSPIRPTQQARRRPSLRPIVEGMRYALSRRDLLGTYLVDLAAMIFAFPYALFPFLATSLGATWALGLLYAAGSVGGIAVTLTSGWVSRIHHHGRAIVVAAAAWGLSIALAGLAMGAGPASLWLILVMLACAGGADMVSGIFRGLMWNQTIPDDVRGRMAGIEMLSYSIGPLLGQVRASTMASMTSLRVSLAGGGFMCVVAVAAVAVVIPALWRYDARTDEHALRQRNLHGDGA